MDAREILTNISLGKYNPICEKQTEFAKDCIQLFKDSGATQKQADRATSQIFTENLYSNDTELNQYDILMKVEKMAFIFKD
jgi:hypothetical protein